MYYGWFLQNLEKVCIRTNMHTTVHKCYFLYIHKQILSKVPTLLHSVRTKRPSGNCYISCFLTDNTALIVSV